jgi:hypothetical protein
LILVYSTWRWLGECVILCIVVNLSRLSKITALSF